MPAERHIERFLPHLAAATVATVTLAWWPLTDRLDLPKLVLLVLAALPMAILALRRAVGWPEGLLALATLGALLVDSPQMAVRVEGWVGFVAAAVLLAAGRRASGPLVQRYLLFALAALTGLAWLQALGVPLFNGDLAAFGGRRVVGTLGSPALLGAVLAALLPWLALPPKPAGRWQAWWLGAVCGALLLTGSRTAWAMAAVGALFWLTRAHLIPLLVGGVLALLCDAWTHSAQLWQRFADVAASGGTAAGRVYIWRVLLEGAGQWLGPAHGPESFQRLWPGLQNAFLLAHPHLEGLRSDLRHAHADPLELLMDFGPLGLAVLLLMVLALSPSRGALRGSAPAATLLALVVGGLAQPMLYYPATLALAALVLGMRLGPPTPARWLAPSRGVLLLAALLAATPWLGRRLHSEVVRGAATLARLQGQPDVTLALRAQSLDEGNFRANMELLMACAFLQDETCLAGPLRRLEVLLPNDEVLGALEAFRGAGGLGDRGE